MVDYERSTPISYRRSIVTLLVSLTVSDLLAYFSTRPKTGSDVIEGGKGSGWRRGEGRDSSASPFSAS